MVEYQRRDRGRARGALCNSGMMAVRAADLFRWLGEVGNDNAAGEYYLPDIVNIAAAEGREAVVIEGDPYETAGVNSRAELAHLELEWQRRRREQVLDEGATLIDPESVWFAYDTEARPRRDGRAARRVRPGRRGRRRRDDPRLQPYRGRDHRREGEHRAVRADPARDRARREEQGRQFRRAEEGDGRPREPRSITCPTSATPRSARRPTSARARSPAITTGSASIGR